MGNAPLLIAGAWALSHFGNEGEKMLNRRILLAAAAVLFAAVGQGRAGLISYSGSIVTYTAPASGIYEITAVGGSGGGGDGAIGGEGAIVEDSFSLTAGEMLSVLVGQEGISGSADPGGGGGGTFVVAPGNTPLLIAGGGGGDGDLEDNGEPGGNVANSGSGGGGTGGTTFMGAFAGGGGGGGGLSGNGTNGQTDDGFIGGLGGKSFTNGGDGGTGGTDSGSGGFGGGGGAGTGGGGGGGGGYTGGDGGDGGTVIGPGAGGTSYDAGSHPIFSLDTTLENGSVTITQVPEPSVTALLALGGVGLLVRRGRA